ncbi:MAG: ferrous iron transport protein B [Oscillospiraceae bacterium]
MNDKKFTIALVGNPNCGKTTLFNLMTKSREYVGNWPGVTVEKKVAKLIDNENIIVVDLPGVYSLTPFSPEEKVTKDFIEKENPDLILNIIDTSLLERSLMLTQSISAYRVPMVCALNMADIAKRNGIEVDTHHLETVFNCPFVQISASKEVGIDTLLDVIAHQLVERRRSNKIFSDAATEEEMRNQIGKIAKDSAVIDDIDNFSDKIDKVVTNKWLSIPIFFAISWFIYSFAIQFVGGITSGWAEGLMEVVGEWITINFAQWGVADWLISLIVEGILAGAGNVLIFIPQLFVLFVLLSILEDCGYMSRVAFVMDRIFRFFGLSGKSFIPMVVGTGCSVPGIMASRTIENKKDRLMTVILVPFMPCSAKLPIFALFVGVLFPHSGWVAPSLYIMGVAAVILGGVILKQTGYFKQEPTPFVLELSQYHLPTIKNIWESSSQRTEEFIKKVTTIILAASAVIWALQYFTPSLSVANSAQDSILGLIGRLLAPLFIPLGFGNWQSAVSILTGFAARENVAASINILFGSTDAIRTSFTQLSAYSFMVFTLLSSPCMGAVAAMKKELGSTKLTAFALLFQTGVAYALSMLIYQVGRLIV